MNSSDVTLIVPQWVVDTIHLAQRNWLPFAGTILLGVVIVAVTALFKGKWKIKYATDEAKVKRLVTRLVSWLSIATAALSSWAYFIMQHMDNLKHIPYVGVYIPTVWGIVWGVYTFLTKFKSLEAKGAVWATNSSLKTQQTPSAPVDDLL